MLEISVTRNGISNRNSVCQALRRNSTCEGGLESYGKKNGLFFSLDHKMRERELILSGSLREKVRMGPDDYVLTTGQVDLPFAPHTFKSTRARFCKLFEDEAAYRSINPKEAE